MRPRDRDELAQQRKLEAIQAEPARHRRMAPVALLLVVLLSMVILALLAYQLLGRD